MFLRIDKWVNLEILLLSISFIYSIYMLFSFFFLSFYKIFSLDWSFFALLLIAIFYFIFFSSTALLAFLVAELKIIDFETFSLDLAFFGVTALELLS